ncbi:hypothetical protein D0860_08319 [Hortaea werneckii]|uniref:Uncharacterized protein n=1 Tax=Hortaea werneckii TaxID=91943 RepID=A0A3M7I1U4_HORWE|nr:hypothetical protein D0860_08319 [Hortaea werneckii]RMZ19256.1 hypothetical protein D0859_16752 [Hortaea werneckii]
MRPTQLLRSGGGKIPYPKHVWSPAGGWYAQPANWKQNTAVMGAVVVGICLMVGSVSADREHRDKMPDVRPPLSFPFSPSHTPTRTHTHTYPWNDHTLICFFYAPMRLGSTVWNRSSDS